MASGERACLICGNLFIPNKFTWARQVVCNHARCRRSAKKLRQKSWSEKNPDYFRGPENVERVRQWRRDNPDWRTRQKSSTQSRELQASSKAKSCNTPANVSVRLQDLAHVDQHAAVVGLVSLVAGSVLQDEVQKLLLECLRRGSDLIRRPADSDPMQIQTDTEHPHGKIPHRSGAPAPPAAPI